MQEYLSNLCSEYFKNRLTEWLEINNLVHRCKELSEVLICNSITRFFELDGSI